MTTNRREFFRTAAVGAVGDAVLVADLQTAFVQFNACGFVRRQVSRQFIAENESPEEPRAQTAIEPHKLPPAGAGEIYLRRSLASLFVAH